MRRAVPGDDLLLCRVRHQRHQDSSLCRRALDHKSQREAAPAAAAPSIGSSSSLLTSSLVKVVGGVASGVLLLAAVAFVVSQADRSRSGRRLAVQPDRHTAAAAVSIGRYEGACAGDPGGHRGGQSGAPDRGGAVAVNRIRLILAAVALGALALVPGALATTSGPVHRQRSRRSAPWRSATPTTDHGDDHQLRHRDAHDRLVVTGRHQPRAVQRSSTTPARRDARPGRD